MLTKQHFTSLHAIRRIFSKSTIIYNICYSFQYPKQYFCKKFYEKKQICEKTTRFYAIYMDNWFTHVYINNKIEVSMDVRYSKYGDTTISGENGLNIGTKQFPKLNMGME